MATVRSGGKTAFITVNGVKRKRTAAKTAKNKATMLHAKIVRSRGACENCGESDPTKLQCAHIISRRYSATRTREDNAFCLCAKCHFHFTEWPLEFTKFVVLKIGELKYDRLRFDSTQRPPGWENEVQRLTRIWKKIEAAA